MSKTEKLIVLMYLWLNESHLPSSGGFACTEMLRYCNLWLKLSEICFHKTGLMWSCFMSIFNYSGRARCLHSGLEHVNMSTPATVWVVFTWHLRELNWISMRIHDICVHPAYCLEASQSDWSWWFQPFLCTLCIWWLVNSSETDPSVQSSCYVAKAKKWIHVGHGFEHLDLKCLF